jgi:hypothetical protein
VFRIRALASRPAHHLVNISSLHLIADKVRLIAPVTIMFWAENTMSKLFYLLMYLWKHYIQSVYHLINWKFTWNKQYMNTRVYHKSIWIILWNVYGNLDKMLIYVYMVTWYAIKVVLTWWERCGEPYIYKRQYYPWRNDHSLKCMHYYFIYRFCDSSRPIYNVVRWMMWNTRFCDSSRPVYYY